MSFVYGPLPSRRLGRSLGIDPIPHKTCNYDCVYCLLGRTTQATSQRRDFFPPDQIVAQLGRILERYQKDEIDYVAFSGRGEPTLCASLGWLIRQAKQCTTIPVAVITNGALLQEQEVREELRVADVVMPTLDAADPGIFRRVNRPLRGARLGPIVDGMAEFRSAFEGQLWLEVMLVKGTNDDERSLLGIRDVLARICPDRVHINVPVCPPAETWVQRPSSEAIREAVTILGSIAEIVTPYEDYLDWWVRQRGSDLQRLNPREPSPRPQPSESPTAQVRRTHAGQEESAEQTESKP